MLKITCLFLETRREMGVEDRRKMRRPIDIWMVRRKEGEKHTHTHKSAHIHPQGVCGHYAENKSSLHARVIGVCMCLRVWVQQPQQIANSQNEKCAHVWVGALVQWRDENQIKFETLVEPSHFFPSGTFQSSLEWNQFGKLISNLNNTTFIWKT